MVVSERLPVHLRPLDSGGWELAIRLTDIPNPALQVADLSIEGRERFVARVTETLREYLIKPVC